MRIPRDINTILSDVAAYLQISKEEIITNL